MVGCADVDRHGSGARVADVVDSGGQVTHGTGRPWISIVTSIDSSSGILGNSVVVVEVCRSVVVAGGGSVVVGTSVVAAASTGSVGVEESTDSIGGGSTGSIGVESTGSIGVESTGSIGAESSGSVDGSESSGSSAVGSSSVVPEPVSSSVPPSVGLRSIGGNSTDWSLVGSGRDIDSAESSVVSGRAVVCAADPEIINPAAITKDPVIGPDLRIVRAVCHHCPNIH
ncbi:hypothetical protein GCM10009764_35310 [Nocardia ninae]|uniref:Uncharacterized protein n=1 Tax=Nocardia ninae NBRC 108245 TaxID=1210091 RepID=A0A511MFZ0_9NOCA|nr:hypothetical protein NN4_40910 [Nocardia ninae NBRC 108245]